MTIPFNTIEDPVVEDTIGEDLRKKNEIPSFSTNITSQQFFIKRKLYDQCGKSHQSSNSARKTNYKFNLHPIVWSKEKKKLLSQRKIDTKGIGLLIKPPASF